MSIETNIGMGDPAPEGYKDYNSLMYEYIQGEPKAREVILQVCRTNENSRNAILNMINIMHATFEENGSDPDPETEKSIDALETAILITMNPNTKHD